jgi:hypothetical protein
VGERDGAQTRVRVVRPASGAAAAGHDPRERAGRVAVIPNGILNVPGPCGPGPVAGESWSDQRAHDCHASSAIPPKVCACEVGSFQFVVKRQEVMF